MRIGTDEELVQAYFLYDNEEAITILYLRYYSKIIKYGLSWKKSLDEAKDLVQITWEAFLTWRGAPTVKIFRATIFKIAKQTLLNWDRYEEIRNRNLKDFSVLGFQTSKEWRERLIVNTICIYCGDKAVTHQMCEPHYVRKRRGATEEQMKKPIIKRKR